MSTAGWYKDWEASTHEITNIAEDGLAAKFGDIVNIVKIYTSGWDDSPMDILTFFLCLAAFSRKEIVKENEVFHQNLLLDAYYYSLFAFSAYKGSKEAVLEKLLFLKEEDFIAGEWDKEVLGKAPAWALMVEHDEKNVIVALRGTKCMDEVLVDLAARFVSWRGGHAHLGFLQSLEDLEPMIKPRVEALMDEWQPRGYGLRLVGHSMGAALSALLAIKWTEEFPSWDIHGYGYATPCVISGALEEESTKIFTTFIHHFDAVTRLSMGAIQDLHNGMRLFKDKVGEGSNAMALLRAIEAKAFNKHESRMIEAAGEVVAMIKSNLEREVESNENVHHLFPPGMTYQMWREKRGKDFVTWQMYKSKFPDYGRLSLTRTMLGDHSCEGYSHAFEDMLAITVMERNLWLRMGKSKQQQVREYWDQHAHEDPFHPKYSIDQVRQDLSRESKYKRKAMRKGLIRPFLFLVSMAPKRRVAMAHLMGIELIDKPWYMQFDPHRETYHMLTRKYTGLQARGNQTAKGLRQGFHYMKSAIKQRLSGKPGSINLATTRSNWYMILYHCSMYIRERREDAMPDDVLRLLDDYDFQNSQSLEECFKPHNRNLDQMEEIMLLLFFKLISASAKDEEALREEREKRREEEKLHEEYVQAGQPDEKTTQYLDPEDHKRREEERERQAKENQYQEELRDAKEKQRQRDHELAQNIRDRRAKGQDSLPEEEMPSPVAFPSPPDHRQEDDRPSIDGRDPSHFYNEQEQEDYGKSRSHHKRRKHHVHKHGKKGEDKHDEPQESEERPNDSSEEYIRSLKAEWSGPPQAGDEEDFRMFDSEEEVVAKLSRYGFTVKQLSDTVADHYINSSTRKKANEIYAWGTDHSEDDHWTKKEMAGAGVAAAAAVTLIGVGVPLVPFMGAGLAPLAAGLGILGMTISKAKPGGLIPIVAACLQQRIALAFHDVTVDDYFSKSCLTEPDDDGSSDEETHQDDDDDCNEDTDN